MPKYTDAQKQQWAEQRQQQLTAITDMLKQGVADVFTSEKYMEYLKTMSKFTRYSTNNTILISMQRPEDGRFHRTARDAAAQVAFPMKDGKPDFNRIMDYTLNTHSVIVDVAMETFLEMEREPVTVERSELERCAEKLEDGLRTAYESDKLRDFLKEKAQEFGQEQVKDVLALTVNYRSKTNPQSYDDAAKQAVAGIYVKIPKDAKLQDCMLYTEPAIVGAAVKACFQPEQHRENARQKKPSIRQRLKQAQEKKTE